VLDNQCYWRIHKAFEDVVTQIVKTPKLLAIINIERRKKMTIYVERWIFEPPLTQSKI
jgi:hypothetical protein